MIKFDSENETSKEDLKAKKIANLKALKELQPDNKEIDNQLTILINGKA